MSHLAKNWKVESVRQFSRAQLYLHEVVLAGDCELEDGEVLGDLHDAVAPVVGALGVLDVVDVVVGHHEGSAKVLGVVDRPVADEAVVVLLHPGLDVRLLGRAVVLELGGLQLGLQMLRTVEHHALEGKGKARVSRGIGYVLPKD